MGQYRIIIDRLDNETDEPTVKVITLTTRYTLQDDLVEWVTEEVDSDATVLDIPRTDEFVALMEADTVRTESVNRETEAAIRAGEEFAADGE